MRAKKMYCICHKSALVAIKDHTLFKQKIFIHYSSVTGQGCGRCRADPGYSGHEEEKHILTGCHHAHSHLCN